MKIRWLILLAAAYAALTACSRKTAGDAPWAETNDRVIKAHNIRMRSRSVPDTGVPLGFEAGKMQTLATLPKATLAPGVTAVLAWSKGALVETLEMDRGAAYPAQRLDEELITVVREGSGVCETGGKTLQLAPDSVLYLTPGATRELKAGPEGLKALEVFSPVRMDLLKAAGVAVPDGASAGFPDQGATPSLLPGQVYSMSEIQLAPITDPDPSLPYKRSGAYSRMVWGRNAMLSFVRMDPHSYFPIHNHPEHQLMTLLRGSLTEGVMDVPEPMTDQEHSTVLLPGGMVHDARMNEFGGDALDLFWPVRADYIARFEKQNALYQQVIAPDAKPVKVDGPAVAEENYAAVDASGGRYFPYRQTAGAGAAQGPAVGYKGPGGAAKIVIPAGEYAMPEALAVSPDGKTLYVANAGRQPGENFLYAYDIQNGGSVTGKRKFAMLHLTDAVLSAADPAGRFDSGSSSVAVDADGRVYVATLMGVQIFDGTGLYVGCLRPPQHAVRITFGGRNGDTLYMAGEKEVWSIQTRVKGRFRLPAGRN